jgi:CRP-like cAMP-binding protein
MSGMLEKYARYEQVLRKEPGSRTLAECCVLDEWAQGVPLLEHMDENSRLDLCQAATTKEYPGNRTIVSAGQRAERMFIVLSGQVSIMVDGLRGPKCIASLGPGGTFGELELLTGEKHSSSAVAINPVIMIIVDAATFGSTLAQTYGKELFDRARFLQSTTPFR